MSEIINYFNIFNNFPQNLRQIIKAFYVSNQKFGFCVLNDNKVYGFGKDIHKRLGYNENSEKYVLIKELCEQNIIEFYEGGDNCMFARNDKNQIFSWGGNEWAELARGFRSGKEYLSPQKIDFFDDKNIIQIICGSYHCLALSSDGRLYGWGDNKNGQIGCPQEDKFISIPIEIGLKEKIKFIHCEGYISCAVTFNGSAYYWGYCGYGLRENIFIRKSIPVKNVLKLYSYYSQGVLIILDKNRKVFTFNHKNEKINKIKSEEKFNDLYCDYYKDDLLPIYNYNCLLQSEGWVYQLEFENELPRLFATSFINFFDYCSHKFKCSPKTVHISDSVLITEDIDYEEMTKTIILKDNIVFKRKYDNCFEQIRRIGFGGFGEVFEVKDKNNDCYAIKRVELNDDFNLKEIKIMSNLNSDFVVLYIDSWIEGKDLFNTKAKPILYIQMELCSHNLREFIQLTKKLYENRFKTINYYISCELFKELIESVNYLHSLNPPIIHRDLKSENILISDGINGRFLKLCDFGLAKIHEMSDHTRMAGTMNYMAPEVKDSRSYNTKSDIYSLALIATEIFRFEDNIRVIRKYKKREDFDKYLSEFLNTNLKNNFKQLLETLSKCLLPNYLLGFIPNPKDYHSRPDCRQLLNNFNEFSIDKSIVKNDENILKFESFLETTEKYILKKFFLTKIK